MIREDRACEHAKEDLFGREPIVSMITNAITHKATHDHGCFVIGVYGKWGEGKSSVLNFVKERLLRNGNDNILISEFNPWLFKDQESLLMSFFGIIADERIDKRFVKLVKKYAPIIAFGTQILLTAGQLATGVPMTWISSITKRIRSIAKFMPVVKTSVMQRKKEISATIKKSGKHLVVFIDDIDRLDKDEVHAVFKLIKQNADFDNVIYLLAMDVEMVAKSLSHKFGSGEIAEGYNFIDKVVQVPVTLPKIQYSRLKSLLANELCEVLSELPTIHDSVTDYIAVVTDEIVGAVAVLFDTRRDILRYINQLQFILPTLCNEVDIYDLCLLEAVKLIHPTGYNAIYENEDYIFHRDRDWVVAHYLEKPNSKETVRYEQEARARFLNSVMSGCPRLHYTQIEKIIKEDLLRTYFGNNAQTKGRGLSDGNYFNRYFTACASDGQIPDSEFYSLANQIDETNHYANADILNELMKHYGWGEVRRAIEGIINLGATSHLKNEITKRLTIAMSLIEPKGKNIHPWTVANSIAPLLGKMIVSSTDSREQLQYDQVLICDTCNEIIASASIDFLLSFTGAIQNHIHISHQEQVDLLKAIVDRVTKERDVNVLFNCEESVQKYLFPAWADIDQESCSRAFIEKLADPEFKPTLFFLIFKKRDPSGYEVIDNIFRCSLPVREAFRARLTEQQITESPILQEIMGSFEDN